MRPQTRLPKPVGSHGIKVAKTGVRKNDGRRQSVEQGNFFRFKPELPQFALAVGFGTCKCLVDRFAFAESFGYSDCDFVIVSRSGHKCDACRHSRFDAHAPAQAEDRIENRASGPR
ncbi:MAG: hypothetical protein Udaeo_07690 [Candidatus Udaeobacter sp.]|nr:MAG: hypothetical protein Udaeo_07690 [Candidatus Udaeobacter sp.]